MITKIEKNTLAESGSRTGAFLATALFAAARLAIAPPSAAAEESVPAWLGSAQIVASVPFAAADEAGAEAETRLIFDSKPESGVRFRAEGGLRWSYGGSSEAAVAFDARLAAPPEPADLPPGTDLHRVVFLDQAYAEAALGRADLSFGVVPSAWGTGYVFNPTSRTAPPVFPEDATDTAPGALGTALRLGLNTGFSAEAYAIAEPRLRSTVPAIDELAADSFPFGAKVQFRSDAVDVSASFLRELMTADSDAAYWVGADAAGFLGSVSWYAEAALRLPGDGGSSASDWNMPNETEACAGLSWTMGGLGATFRSEAAWFGTGAGAAGDYDTRALLAGTRALLARRYLFAQLEKEDPEAARWTVSGGTLVNLDDFSAALIGEAKFSPLLSVELSAFVYAFIADGDGELGGDRDAGGIQFAPYRSAAGLSAKVSF